MKTAPQEAFRDLQQAFTRFFNGLKGKGPKVGYPKFKNKRVSKKSFRLTGSIHVEENRIKVPRIGWLRLKEKGYIPAGAKVASLTISERAGKWFVSALCHHNQQEPPLFKGGEVVGVDLGSKVLAFTSDGREFPNPKAYRKLEKQLAKLQRRMSRQQKGSHRRERTRQRIAELHYRIACIRSDSTHKATTEIARTKQLSVVVLEDLNVKGMVKNRKLSKTIQDAAWGELRRQVGYKSKWNGFEMVLAPRFFPSSKTCSGCGHIKPELTLDERTYVCSECSLVIDRDYNAALNLRNWYIVSNTASSAGSGRGEDVRPEVACNERQTSLKRQPDRAPTCRFL
jgi:putative transposase